MKRYCIRNIRVTHRELNPFGGGREEGEVALINIPAQWTSRTPPPQSCFHPRDYSCIIYVVVSEQLQFGFNGSALHEFMIARIFLKDLVAKGSPSPVRRGWGRLNLIARIAGRKGYRAALRAVKRFTSRGFSVARPTAS